MEHLTKGWTQLGPFFSKSRHFFQFLKKGSGAPLPLVARLFAYFNLLLHSQLISVADADRSVIRFLSKIHDGAILRKQLKAFMAFIFTKKTPSQIFDRILRVRLSLYDANYSTCLNSRLCLVEILFSFLNIIVSTLEFLFQYTSYWD